MTDAAAYDASPVSSLSEGYFIVTLSYPGFVTLSLSADVTLSTSTEVTAPPFTFSELLICFSRKEAKNGF